MSFFLTLNTFFNFYVAWIKMLLIIHELNSSYSQRRVQCLLLSILLCAKFLGHNCFCWTFLNIVKEIILYSFSEPGTTTLQRQEKESVKSYTICLLTENCKRFPKENYSKTFIWGTMNIEEWRIDRRLHPYILIPEWLVLILASQ